MISQRWTPHDEAFVLVTIVDECIGPLVLIQHNGTPAVANFEKVYSKNIRLQIHLWIEVYPGPEHQLPILAAQRISIQSFGCYVSLGSTVDAIGSRYLTL